MIPLWWCRVALLGILAVQPIWFGWVHPPSVVPPWLVLVVTMLPLLLVLPGAWRLRPRSLVIAGSILLMHFCLAVMEAWANPPARWPAIAQIVLVVIYFTALPAVRKQKARSD